LDSTAKPSNKNFKPLVKVITVEQAIEWDTQEKCFMALRELKHTPKTKNRKRTHTGRVLKKWLLQAVARNPRVGRGRESSSENESSSEEEKEEKQPISYGEGGSSSSSSSSSSS
jgi:hypothetical protein